MAFLSNTITRLPSPWTALRGSGLHFRRIARLVTSQSSKFGLRPSPDEAMVLVPRAFKLRTHGVLTEAQLARNPQYGLIDPRIHMFLLFLCTCLPLFSRAIRTTCWQNTPRRQGALAYKGTPQVVSNKRLLYLFYIPARSSPLVTAFSIALLAYRIICTKYALTY